MKHVNMKSQAGFSLVELMVVVAIIGILASLAIPSVGKYMAKARQSEAKTQLASLYTAEKAFFSEYTAYDSRFGSVGYSPEGKLRYRVGFSGAGFQATALNGYNPPPGVNASIDTVAFCGAMPAGGNIGASGCGILNGATNAQPPALPAAVTTANTFVAAAIGVIHQGVAAGDAWTMTQNKELNNTVSGIP